MLFVHNCSIYYDPDPDTASSLNYWTPLANTDGHIGPRPTSQQVRSFRSWKALYKSIQIHMYTNVIQKTITVSNFNELDSLDYIVRSGAIQIRDYDAHAHENSQYPSSSYTIHRQSVQQY